MGILDMPSAAAFLRLHFKHTLLRRHNDIDRNLCSSVWTNLWATMLELPQWLCSQCIL